MHYYISGVKKLKSKIYNLHSYNCKIRKNYLLGSAKGIYIQN